MSSPAGASVTGVLAVACALRFLGEAHPRLLRGEAWPRLAAHAEQCEAMEVFRTVAQPFAAPG